MRNRLTVSSPQRALERNEYAIERLPTFGQRECHHPLPATVDMNLSMAAVGTWGGPALPHSMLSTLSTLRSLENHTTPSKGTTLPLTQARVSDLLHLS
jgi:hypothetical protein